MNILTDINFDYTLRIVALGSAILGALSGALGAFAVLRKQSLIGDTISHAALPGIALAGCGLIFAAILAVEVVPALATRRRQPQQNG